ncbi:M23 family metallopeptidase [Apibacter muscae]|uniref:M23 family metallopeptidase n=1 Tax=Apibacter muscae TaxID=2509004 RepID=A0A563D9A9_9FLAO|nr:M23 family metallopeptidase [Apibacter muscae]TWP26796.1 M23 family metallopeptidase [Apibacter muscae]
MLFQLWSSEIKNFSIEDVEKNLWARQAGFDDKSLARSVNEFNLAFTKYGINSCMQKIVFLALGYAETRFKSLGEEISSFNSSKSIYKGRGFHQLTGTRDGNGFYNSPGPYENYATAVGNQNIISHPDLICKNIHYAIDSAGWFWTDPNWGKKVPLWSSSSNVKYIKFRADYFSKALGKPLNEVSHLVEDDEKYFWLQAKLLNGYPKGEKLEIDPNGWKTRKNAFDILKNNVFEFNIRCKGNDGLKFNGKWHDPVDNPQRTKYNSYGYVKPENGAYGNVRNNGSKYHSGLDLFALPDITPIYAPLDCTIAGITEGPVGGKVVRIKIDKTKDLLEQEKIVNYKLEFKHEEMGINIKETDSVYFIYMHLSAIPSKKLFTTKDVGKKIKAGEIIGYTGVTGNANGIPSPHLHLEVATVMDPFNNGGRTKRTNPARFIKLNSYDTKEQDDASKKNHNIKYE